MLFKQALKPQFQSLRKIKNVRELNIPLKIERSPTELLQTLSHLVKKDYNAPEYKFHDDPYFIPLNNSEKRSYSLAKASGKSAARYFLDKYPNYFEDFIDFPKIDKFYSKKHNLSVISHKNEQDLLNQLINFNAPYYMIIKAYEKLKGENKLTEAQLLNMLQYVAFYNSTDPNIGAHETEKMDEELISNDNEKTTKATNNSVSPNLTTSLAELSDDVYWYRNYTGLQKFPRRWKNLGFANQIWDDLKDPKPLPAYTIMICALNKYNSPERAFALYEEMKQNDMKVPLRVYNSLLKAIPLVTENNYSRWSKTLEMLNDMARTECYPNVETFVELMGIAASLNAHYKMATNLCLEILAEYKTYFSLPNDKSSDRTLVRKNEAKLENYQSSPSLAMFYHLLTAFYRDKYSSSSVIYEVMDYLQGKHFTINHENDVEFFKTAMQICYTNVQDVNLANTLLDTYFLHNNRYMIGHEDNHRQFFINYFRLLLKRDQLKNVIAAYDKLIPNEFCLEFGLLREFFRYFGKHHNQYAPQLTYSSNIQDETQLQKVLDQQQKQYNPSTPITSNIEEFIEFSQFMLRFWSDLKLYGFFYDINDPPPSATGNLLDDRYVLANRDLFKLVVPGIINCLFGMDHYKETSKPHDISDNVSEKPEIQMGPINEMKFHEIKEAFHTVTQNIIKTLDSYAKSLEKPTTLEIMSGKFAAKQLKLYEKAYEMMFEDIILILVKCGAYKDLKFFMNKFENSRLLNDLSSETLELIMSIAVKNFDINLALVVIKANLECKYQNTLHLCREFLAYPAPGENKSHFVLNEEQRAILESMLNDNALRNTKNRLQE